MTKLIPVSEVHKLDENRLAQYLTSVGLNEFENGLEAKQFQGDSLIRHLLLMERKAATSLEKNPPANCYPLLI